jgi:hypothetical protein
MTVTRKLFTLAILAAVTGPVTGCVVYTRPRQGVVYINEAPPAARVEVIPAAPGPAFVWIRGYWRHNGQRYAWVPGRWERPVDGHREWVAERYVHDRNGWYLVEGHWR